MWALCVHGGNMIYLRFFIYGFVFSGALLYIISEISSPWFAVGGGASFITSLIAVKLLNKIYSGLLDN